MAGTEKIDRYGEQNCGSESMHGALIDGASFVPGQGIISGIITLSWGGGNKALDKIQNSSLVYVLLKQRFGASPSLSVEYLGTHTTSISFLTDGFNLH